jgi:transketolase
MSAAHLQLGRLVAIVDRNGWQISGHTEDCMRLEPLAARWEAFGWRTITVDGHDVDELTATLSRESDADAAPTVVLAATVKGRGVRFLEGRKSCHFMHLSPDLHRRALASLEATNAMAERSDIEKRREADG